MTVQDLRELLEDMDDDTLIICGHDGRYTFGSLQYPNLATVNDDGEILREEELY
jgi:glyoxylase-like metal-dependent hydrolase (beta-lactamase superfamily II)